MHQNQVKSNVHQDIFEFLNMDGIELGWKHRQEADNMAEGHVIGGVCRPSHCFQ